MGRPKSERAVVSRVYMCVCACVCGVRVQRDAGVELIGNEATTYDAVVPSTEDGCCTCGTQSSIEPPQAQQCHCNVVVRASMAGQGITGLPKPHEAGFDSTSTCMHLIPRLAAE